MIWPFPQLRYRIKHGYWCDHRNYSEFVSPPGGVGQGFSPWRMIDLGRKKMRQCHRCNYTEFIGY